MTMPNILPMDTPTQYTVTNKYVKQYTISGLNILKPQVSMKAINIPPSH